MIKIKKDRSLNGETIADFVKTNRNVDYFGGLKNTVEEIKRQIQEEFCCEIDTRGECNILGVIDEIAKWLVQDETCKLDLRKGIMLVGNVGVGKTELMRAVMKVIEKNKAEFGRHDKGRVVNGFIDNRYYCYENGNIKTREYLFTDLRSGIIAGNDFLFGKAKEEMFAFIDDISYGMNNGWINYYGNKINIIEEIITSRYANKCITFATANSVEFENKAVEDRIEEMFNVVRVKGLSRTERKKLEVINL